MSTPRKFLILAPYWQTPGHVGNYRVDRFMRWLKAIDVPIVLVRSGAEDGERETAWGAEIMVRDPLNLYGTIDESGDHNPVNRRPNPLRRWVAEWVFNPDLPIVWSKRAARHPLVRQYMPGITDILASSPPDAIHVGAQMLAAQYGKRLILDRRDGWLDEPLKPLLQRSRIRRLMEGRLEARVLRQASTIFVSSPVWKEHLTKRHPKVADKTTVLTNAYPNQPASNTVHATKSVASEKDAPVKLLHAGRFTGSNNRQRPRLLLGPLLHAMQNMPQEEAVNTGSILCLGSLEAADFEEIDQFNEPFQHAGWTLETRSSVPREEVLQIMAQMNGLLLLSTPFASIPSKFFEYLITGKPILAVTHTGSAIWRIGQDLPQVFLIDLDHKVDYTPVIDFLNACRRYDHFPEPPEAYTEAFLSKIFINALQLSQ